MKINNNGSDSSWWPPSRWRALRQAERQSVHFQRLAVQLHYDLPRTEARRSVLLVTPTASALSSHCSVTLACYLGDAVGQPVLLVDAGIEGQKSGSVLDYQDDQGFGCLLSNPGKPIDDFVLPTTHKRVSFIPAAKNLSSYPPEAVGAAVRTVEEQFDFVVFAGGSMLSNHLAVELAPRVGCVLLLVIENETLLEDLEAAQNALRLCGSQKTGVVMATLDRRERRDLKSNPKTNLTTSHKMY